MRENPALSVSHRLKLVVQIHGQYVHTRCPRGRTVAVFSFIVTRPISYQHTIVIQTVALEWKLLLESLSSSLSSSSISTLSIGCTGSSFHFHNRQTTYLPKHHSCLDCYTGIKIFIIIIFFIVIFIYINIINRFVIP